MAADMKSINGKISKKNHRHEGEGERRKILGLGVSDVNERFFIKNNFSNISVFHVNPCPAGEFLLCHRDGEQKTAIE
jgi:hypothetical protein